jgi:alkanesulfonate monooxygenase SsuD/methylene tetrahydromethanopterin reductase-like flavin-dependent oxidoreductase (luciferase family)
MRFGLALPHYDYSVHGEHPLTFATIVAYAQRAKELGFSSLWMSDHLFLDLAKYNGPDTREFAYDPIVSLAALAQAVPDVRLGTLVALEALRPASVAAKAFATVDRISGGRLDIGLGAGWYEPDYEAIGIEMPRPGVRLKRLDEAVAVVQGLVGGGPFSFDGEFHSAHSAHNMPGSLQQPSPPIFVGGKGDKLLDLVARRGIGWNTCWAWTTDAYRERLEVLDAACVRHDRDPASVWRTLGLYALAGENEADLQRRFARVGAQSPKGVLDGVTLDTWRSGRLVGTVDEVREQAIGWRDLGIETLMLNPGCVPFQIAALDDLEPLAAALTDL